MGDQAHSDDGAVVSGLLAADILPDLHGNQAFCDGDGGGGPPTPSSIEAQGRLELPSPFPSVLYFEKYLVNPL